MSQLAEVLREMGKAETQDMAAEGAGKAEIQDAEEEGPGKAEIRNAAEEGPGKAEIQDAEAEEPADITEIEIDRKKPVSERAEEYVEKTGNPFLVRVGAYVVKVGFSDCPETLNDRMKQYIKKMAEISY